MLEQPSHALEAATDLMYKLEEIRVREENPGIEIENFNRD